MNKLPAELLREIFHESVFDKDGEPSYWLSSPLAISHVCHRWREVSLEFGALWSYLNIRDEVPRNIVGVFDAWLQRTNKSPINFTLDVRLDGDADEESLRLAERIITSLFQQQQRWRDVWIYYCGWSPSPDFSRTLSSATDMPLLRSLHLSSSYVEYDEPSFEVDISRSSRLESLWLQSCRTIRLGDGVIYTQAKLFFIAFAGEHLDEMVHQCLDFLRVAPNLTEFRVSLGWGDVTLPSHLNDSQGVVVHNLKILHVEESGWYPEYFLDRLRLPFLEQMHFTDIRDELAGDELLNFFKRSRPPLALLDISGILANEPSLVNILEELPTLQELHISNCWMSTWLPTLLTLRRDADRIICPFLRSFRLEDMLIESLAEGCIDALCAMLESRRNFFRGVWVVRPANSIGRPLCDSRPEGWRSVLVQDPDRVQLMFDMIEMPFSQEARLAMRNCVARGEQLWAVDQIDCCPFSPFSWRYSESEWSDRTVGTARPQ